MQHHLPKNLEEANVVGLDKAGNIMARACMGCGLPACYGRGTLWACGSCWQTVGLWKTRQ